MWPFGRLFTLLRKVSASTSTSKWVISSRNSDRVALLFKLSIVSSVALAKTRPHPSILKSNGRRLRLRKKKKNIGIFPLLSIVKHILIPGIVAFFLVCCIESSTVGLLIIINNKQ